MDNGGDPEEGAEAGVHIWQNAQQRLTRVAGSSVERCMDAPF